MFDFLDQYKVIFIWTIVFMYCLAIISIKIRDNRFFTSSKKKQVFRLKKSKFWVYRLHLALMVIFLGFTLMLVYIILDQGGKNQEGWFYLLGQRPGHDN